MGSNPIRATDPICVVVGIVGRHPRGAMLPSVKQGAFLAAAIILGSCAAPTATVSSSPIASASGVPATSACGPVAHEATGTVLFASDLSGRCKKNQLQPAELNFILGHIGPLPGQNFERVQGPDDYRLLLKPDHAVDVDAGGLARTSQYDSPPPADVQIEVDARAVAGSAGTLYGIMCRFNSRISTPTVDIPAKLYVFMVGSDGTYLVQYLAGGSTTLASGVAASVIRSGGNHVRAACIGRTLTLYVNGQKIVSVDHGELADGLSGVWARTLDTAGAEIVFRNFVVSQP